MMLIMLLLFVCVCVCLSLCMCDTVPAAVCKCVLDRGGGVVLTELLLYLTEAIISSS